MVVTCSERIYFSLIYFIRFNNINVICFYFYKTILQDILKWDDNYKKVNTILAMSISMLLGFERVMARNIILDQKCPLVLLIFCHSIFVYLIFTTVVFVPLITVPSFSSTFFDLNFYFKKFLPPQVITSLIFGNRRWGYAVIFEEPLKIALKSIIFKIWITVYIFIILS